MTEDFQWTDELVQQFAKEYRASSSRVSIDMFKKYQNPKEYNKDWEILSYKIGDVVYKKFLDGVFVTDGDDFEAEKMLFYRNAGISSVKRLCDGAIFSIGDNLDGYGKIVEFVIMDGAVVAEFKNKIGWVSIEFLRKPKEQQSSAVKNTIMGKDYFSDKETHERLKAMPKISEPKEQPPQRIEVSEPSFIQETIGGGAQYYFSSCPQIPAGKFTIIKQAIDQVLNDEHTVKVFGTDYVMVQKDDWEKRKTKQQVDELCEKAFNAARDMVGGYDGTGWGGSSESMPVIKQKYSTYLDYKNTKQ